MIRLFCLSQGSRLPSPRFRLFQYLEYLREHGIDATVHSSFPNFYALPRKLKFRPFYHALNILKLMSRTSQLLGSAKYDAVLLQRELLPYRWPFLEKWLAHLCRHKALIYDFDDAIYLNYPGTGSANKIAQIISMADLVLAGNRHLAEYAATFNENVAVLPTPIDVKQYQPKDFEQKEPNNPFVIGWSGTDSNLDYLRDIAPAINQVLEKNAGTIIRILCNRVDGKAPQLPFPFEFVEWSEKCEADVIRSFDCGLMPLRDNEWCRGKCSLKILLYFALGVPAIASPVGNNIDVIQSEQNGLFASSNSDWQMQLERIVEDSALRSKLRSAGLETVRTKYSSEVCAQQLASHLKEAIARKQQPRA